MRDLGTLGGTNSTSYAINSGGQVVGESDVTGDTAQHAFITNSGGMQDLGTLGGTDSYAYGINSGGEVVGWSDPAGNTTQDAFLYSNGSMQDIGALPGGYFLSANAINFTGQIVGSGAVIGCHPTAYLYSKGSYQDLDTVGTQCLRGGEESDPYAINAAGQVVGWYDGFPRRAFLYSNGKMTDLNTLDTTSPLAQYILLMVATGINDNGWIVANGIDTQTGAMHAYLLIPLVPPTAVAGANQTISVGQTVSLNGLGSYAADTSSASLKYAWSFVSMPSGSSATLSGANTATPSFVANEYGTYIIQLIVTDPATGLSSTPSQVMISSTWTPPTADAGPAQSVIIGNTVTLSGSGSDANGFALSYSWNFVSVPSGSTATLVNGNTPNASFVPNVAGSYTLTLTVSDTLGSSAPSRITISVVTAADYAQQQIGNAINYLAGMPDIQFQAHGHRKSFTNLLQEAISAIQAGNTSLAKHKLTSVLIRTDGYPLRGALDGSDSGMDWIIDPTAQEQVYTDLTNALNALPRTE